jgi:hypothetical protein
MVALAAEVAVVGRAFLLAIGRADRAVRVENQLVRWSVLAKPVHPLTGHSPERIEVVRVAQHICLKAGHLARGGGVPIHGAPSHDMTHDRIDLQPFGVVDIFIPSQTAIDGLADQGCYRMTDIAAGTKVEQFRGTRFSQLSRLIEIPKREKAGIRTDLCPMELQLDDAFETDSQSLLTCFPHRGLPLFTDRA